MAKYGDRVIKYVKAWDGKRAHLMHPDYAERRIMRYQYFRKMPTEHQKNVLLANPMAYDEILDTDRNAVVNELTGEVVMEVPEEAAPTQV